MPALLDLRRTVAATVAVALSAALIVFSLVVTDTYTTQASADARTSIHGADVVVTSEVATPTSSNRIPTEVAEEVEALDQVASVRGEHWSLLDLDLPEQLRNGANTDVRVLDLPDLDGPTSLTDGRLPQATGELAIDTTLAQSRGLRVGDTLNLVASAEEEGGEGSESSLSSSSTVVGIVSAGADSGEMLESGASQYNKIYATPEQLEAIGASTDYSFLYVTAAPGADTAALQEEVAQVVHASSAEADVASAEEVVVRRTAESAAGGGIITTLLNLLALVCVLVAGIVIATTFATLVARQTRQVGLLRCVGATRRQVLRSVLRTGALTGLVGSAAGAVLGIAGTALLVRAGAMEQLDGASLTISPAAVLLAVIATTVVTLVSVLRPARRAARVSPLIAVTGQDLNREHASRRRRRVAAFGALLLLAGLVTTIAGMSIRSISTAAAGGAVLVIGLLLALPLLVTAGAALIERLCSAQRFPVLHLAARNLGRNPGRSAASAATILVGVGVGAVLFTGLFSFQSSFQNILNDVSQKDITVLGVTPENEATVTSAVAEAEGVESLTTVPVIDVTQTVDGTTQDLSGIAVLDTEAISPVVYSTAGLEDLEDGVLIVGGIYGIPDGTTVTLTGPAGSTEVTARVREGWGAVVTPGTAQQLTGGTGTNSMVWARATEGNTPGAAEANIREALRGQEVMVDGREDAFASVTHNLNQIVLMVSVVLGLSLVIALVGLANTTRVSILERTREIGVLRAMGTQRTEVRRLVVAENVLTAGLGGLLGIATGTLLGAVGMMTIISVITDDLPTGENSQEAGSIAVSVPFLPLVITLLVALAVGVLASLRPAGAASRVPPVQALAVD
ncbi:ABC transporter permease [Actinomyces lilanjuaniae]|uniref:ABC transporter permease n=1 Tax=Actinomyces lilanjuaniae TaxID=2321394 RepID=A0ABN5PLX8_9ACTO|nr:ABC transporter permease [Actinomyces lilanjuaniae]AYD89232.1 ABC transporter permease [Actinomyces lilanjuaniae]